MKKWKRLARKITAPALTCAAMAFLLAGCGTSTASTSNSAVVSSSSSKAVVSTASGDTTTGDSKLLQEIKEKGYITVATSNDAPFCYTDSETGELKGLDTEILRAVCDKLGIEDIKPLVTDFSNLLVELNNGNCDMVTDAMYIRDERKEIAAFSDIWYQEGEAVVVPVDSKFTTKESLKDARVGAQPGTAFYDTAQEWLDNGEIKELVSYEDQSTLMLSVNTGKIDACITDGIVAAYTISQDSGLELKLMDPYEPEATGMIGSAVRFEDEDFLMEFNDALNELKEDGTIEKILEEYGLNDSYFVGVEEGKTENIK